MSKIPITNLIPSIKNSIFNAKRNALLNIEQGTKLNSNLKLTIHVLLIFEFSLLSSILHQWIDFKSKIYCPICLSQIYTKSGTYERKWVHFSFKWRVQRYKCDNFKQCKKTYNIYSNTKYKDKPIPPIYQAFTILKIQIKLMNLFSNSIITEIEQKEDISGIKKFDQQTLSADFINLMQFFFINCLNEVQKRLFAGLMAIQLGRGGQKKIHDILGIWPKAIRRGTIELFTKSNNVFIGMPLRASGAGRPKHLDDLNFQKNLMILLEDETAGDPITLLKWTRRSLLKICKNLSLMGINVSSNTVRTTLISKNYSLKVNSKNKSNNADHPLRNAQFEWIKSQRSEFLNTGYPVLSLDGKKKEMIANFKNPGKTWRVKPYETLDHEFPDMIEGMLTPYGIYDLNLNKGWIYAGKNHSTAELAVEALIYWWINNEQYHYLEKILIFCDSGGANSYRSFLWKYTLQELFVDRFRISVHVSHYPPGTSKWNPIEHKLFSYISINWAGKPLISYETAINYIRSTSTETGLSVNAQLTEKLYTTGKKISRIEFNSINISYFGPNPKWNYCIKPRSKETIKNMKIDLIDFQNRPPASKTIQRRKNLL